MRTWIAILMMGCSAYFSRGETDQRLHADGPGWRLDRAEVRTPARTRVLLIGDSILSGYRQVVISGLKEHADVDVWVHPHCQSTHLNHLLAQVLTNGPYDVVHFNIGLHGWQAGRIKAGTFEPLTRAFVDTIRSALPRASIIWANTTPVTVKGDPSTLDPEINPIIIEHNRMAQSVMAEADVPVHDFYGLLVNRLEWARGDQFHWTTPAYTLLGRTVVDSILSRTRTPR